MRNQALNLLFISTLSGCSQGFLYTDVTQPKCVDMRSTPIGEKAVKGGTYKFEIPATRIDMSAEWNSRAIGEVAKKEGMHTVYYCDQRTLSILGSIYRKREIIVYGE